MGAGQIGGIATLLDIDFQNVMGFEGQPAKTVEAHAMVYYMSHAMLFCSGALLEPHVVLTPANCVYTERRKFNVFAGSIKFLKNAGTPRLVQDICIHKGYNHSLRFTNCSTDNLALLVLEKPYSFLNRETGSEYNIHAIRYGATHDASSQKTALECHYYGWGSRRNGYLVPLLISLYRVTVDLLPSSKCHKLWNRDRKYLCLRQPNCKSSNYGALCPDDMGSPLICNGYVYGMMTSRAIDRPCGTGFLDVTRYTKFLTCGIDATLDVVEMNENLISFDHTTKMMTPFILTLPSTTPNGTDCT